MLRMRLSIFRFRYNIAIILTNPVDHVNLYRYFVRAIQFSVFLTIFAVASRTTRNTVSKNTYFYSETGSSEKNSGHEREMCYDLTKRKEVITA